MIEGAIWRKWVFFYVPMALFLLFLLFPFYWMVITSVRPDGELYRPWNAVNYNPFWTWKPTWDHVRYLFEETLDRKSTRLNSSHRTSSYAVFCLKKKKKSIHARPKSQHDTAHYLPLLPHSDICRFPPTSLIKAHPQRAPIPRSTA